MFMIKISPVSCKAQLMIISHTIFMKYMDAREASVEVLRNFVQNKLTKTAPLLKL